MKRGTVLMSKPNDFGLRWYWILTSNTHDDFADTVSLLVDKNNRLMTFNPIGGRYINRLLREGATVVNAELLKIPLAVQP